MDMYQYIASNNQLLVRNLAHKYGYGLKANPNLALVLEQLVASQGEPALMDILDNHPDRGILEEYFDKKKKDTEPVMKASGGGCGCQSVGCNGNKGGCSCSKKESTVAFDGAAAFQESKKITDTTSVIILASAMLIAVAVISIKP